MEAYCFKCKQKREIEDPQPTFTASASPATRGTCPVCGTKMFRMGRTPAHEGLTPPKPAKKKKKNTRRKGKLVVVESPAKAKTVKRYLGTGYTVKASVGHVRDLLRSQLSVDVENDFQPKYRVPNDKRPVVKEIKALSQGAAEIYLATDPDREGEAIAWHLMEAAEMDPQRTQRVVFHEITSNAVQQAFSHPRGLDMHLVDAQQARRILDRLVGYNLSPILWRKVRSRLSAGRVQSVALRMVVDREREIDAFVPEEYWSIDAEFRPQGLQSTFIARLRRIDDKKPVLDTEETVRPILADMEQASYQIGTVKRGERRRKPPPPFITSTLQQDASRRLGFSARKTMRVAQQLYEGIDIDQDASTGLITYMRTDSTHVSQDAQQQARQYIEATYGERFLPKSPPKYRTKAQRAQEAHEAIRPTSVRRDPKSLKSHLSRDQYRLYSLIWQRFLASQMAAALYDTLSVDVNGRSQSHGYGLRASGSTLRFVGFLLVYKDRKADKEQKGSDDKPIPDGLEAGQRQRLVRLIPDQHFTQPPARYSEASLVRALEENGIGRPSTYAPILGTLQQRGYVEREKRRLVPTEIGYIVNDLLAQYFPNILDSGFTARMEDQLDRIASGEQPWVQTVGDFYGPFAEQVDIAKAEMPEVKMEPEPLGRTCPRSGHELVLRWGRYGKFISCSGFPECRYTEPWLEKIGVGCPQDGGELVERKTRRGRTFYGCSNYPECDFTSWKRPVERPCPNCAGLLVIANKNRVECIRCGESYEMEPTAELNTEH